MYFLVNARVRPCAKLPPMALARQAKIILAIVAASVFLFAMIGVFVWLANSGPVLYRSEEVDPLSKNPKTVILNPLRDRSSERPAAEMIAAMHEGQCRAVLQDWFKDYRRKYAESICQTEQDHPLVSWRLVDRQDQPPLVMLHYRSKRRESASAQPYEEDLWVTTQQDDGVWHPTKYVPLY
jgi:hypothetical protein